MKKINENDTSYDLILGSFCSFVSPNYFLGAVNEAIENNENGFMIYTGAPQNTKRVDADKFHYEQGKELWLTKNNNLSNIIVHCPYIVNPASPDNEKRMFAIDFIVNDLIRCHYLGIKYYVLHPGKYMESDLKTGIRQCADSINQIHTLTRNTNITICLETMAGVGTEIASKFIYVKDIIDHIKDQNRIGVCIDTCHLWDAGYDVKDPDNVLKQFDDAIGLKYLKCMHINDSKNQLGSKKDRHENLGYGYIGFDALLAWVYHKYTNGVIKVLETPFVNGKSPYKQEISMLRNKKFIDWIKNKEDE